MNLEVICDFIKKEDNRLKVELYNAAYFGELTLHKIAKRCNISEEKARSIKQYIDMCITQDKMQGSLTTGGHKTNNYDGVLA